MRQLLVMCAVAIGLASAAPAVAAQGFPARAYVTAAPPAAGREEVIARRPGPRYQWTRGYYVMRRGRYVWVPGRWILPPPGRGIWIPGYWARDVRGWYWREGFWR